MMTISPTALADALLRDRARQQGSTSANYPECMACGRSYSRGVGRFCSDNCQAGFDNGLGPHDPGYASKSTARWYSLPMGRTGFLIDCAACKKQFDSRGLRCCSPECERSYRSRQDSQAILQEVGMEAPRKRACLECSGPIPNWRKGRKVSSSTRFCSKRCADKSSRKPGNAQKAAPPGFGAADDEKVPVSSAFGSLPQTTIPHRQNGQVPVSITETIVEVPTMPVKTDYSTEMPFSIPASTGRTAGCRS